MPLDQLDLLASDMALAEGLTTVSFSVPAAGPEFELTFDRDDEEAVKAALVQRGFTILASRVRS